MIGLDPVGATWIMAEYTACVKTEMLPGLGYRALAVAF